jgi:hypothetical protein
MEITNLRWLEREPTQQTANAERLKYKLQLLVKNIPAIDISLHLRPASIRAALTQTNLLRFEVPGSFNGRLFECRLTLFAGEVGQPNWKRDFGRKLLELCRTNRDRSAPTLVQDKAFDPDLHPVRGYSDQRRPLQAKY